MLQDFFFFLGLMEYVSSNTQQLGKRNYLKMPENLFIPELILLLQAKYIYSNFDKVLVLNRNNRCIPNVYQYLFSQEIALYPIHSLKTFENVLVLGDITGWCLNSHLWVCNHCSLFTRKIV